MFLKGDIFEKLLCCRRKVKPDDSDDDKVEEEIVLQHTNNNKTEYITSTQLLERLKGGTTAVVALVREKRLVVAWLGDSLALLVRKRTPVHIVQPHKPESASERKRIEDVGGCVVNIQGTWRVLGQLAVSRAIGDVKYKPYLTSECDIKSLEICGDEDFLILACDGLWDNLSPEKAVDIVYSYLLTNDGDTDGVGRCLVEAARSSGSEDNITAIVVFLRPVSALMEEERIRIDQGQVPEMESLVMTRKGSLPPSINAIFSPPEHFNSSSNASAEVAAKDANGHPSPKDSSPVPLPMEDILVPQPPDYDSDEGVGADIVEKGLGSPEEAEGKITAEEVDAALAELDSIPDVGCEAGEVEAEVEEEDDEDEGWSYFKMEPQKQTENEDLIVTGSSEVTVDTLLLDTDIHPSSPEARESPSFVKEASPSGSPTVPGSPRTVEGFVTSVELNTPEESYNTNLAINQSTEYFNGGQIEQNSGPFSVYVSSSPEPASIESPPVNLHASMSSPSPAAVEKEPEGKLVMEETQEHQQETSVEIVHAQSTVEVTDVISEVEVSKEEAFGQIPDIMTQSITGDLPSEPYILSVAEPSQILPLVEDIHFAQETKTSLESLMQETKRTLEEVEENYTEQFSTQSEFVCKESSEITHEIQESITVVKDRVEAVTEVSSFVESPEQIVANVPEPVLNDAELRSTEILEDELETKFTHEINRTFDAPLDQMIASFHEDRIQLSDLIDYSETPATHEELSLPEAPTADLLGGIQDVESLTDQMSNLDVSEQVTKEPELVPSPTIPVATPTAKVDTKKPTPASAPRTSMSRPVPPKPSPRSVGSKPTTTKVTTTTGPASAGPSPGAKTAPKRPTSLTTTTSKPLRKPETAKSSTTTAKSRLSTTTSTSVRASSASATSRATTAMKPAQASALAKTRTAPLKTTSAPPPKTRMPSSTAPKTSPSGVKNRVSATSTTNTTQSSAAGRRVTSATKPTATATKVTSTAISKVSVNGVVPAVSKTATRTSITAAAKKPLTTKTTTAPTTTTRMSSGLAPRKPLSTTTITKNPTSTTSLKQRSVASAPAPAATKDTKNTTNRMLSTTTKTSTTRSSSQPVSRTTTATKTRSPLKTSKTTGLKGEKAAAKSPAKSLAKTRIGDFALENGENKIVEEESSVEVKEKIIDETRVVEVHESAIEETISSVEEIVTMKQDKLLVNGDHHS